MGYVPKGAPKGKKSKEVFYEVDADYIDVSAIDFAGLEVVAGATETVIDSTKDLTIMLPGHAATDLFTVEDDASHVRFSIAGDGTLVLPDNSIDNDMIADDAVDSAQIADDAIVAAAIDDGAIVQAAMADDAIGAAELKVVVRDVTVAGGASTGTVTNAADINGVVLGHYMSNAESAIKTITLTAVDGKLDVTMMAAQAGGQDAHVFVSILQV